MEIDAATQLAVDDFMLFEVAATANLKAQREQAASVLADLPELEQRFAAQEAAIMANSTFLRNMLVDMGLSKGPAQPARAPDDEINLGIVELTFDGLMKQMVREWTGMGATERTQCLGLCLSALKKHMPPSSGARSGLARVIIPGAGLGRLVWEVAMAGYEAVGIENAMTIVLAGSYVINRLLSTGREAAIHPFAALGAGPCNTQAGADVGRAVRVPDSDASARFAEATRAAEADGSQHPHERLQVITGDFRAVARATAGGADAVLTCFFIDACGDPAGAIEAVGAQLAPGGVWVNCGPLECARGD